MIGIRNSTPGGLYEEPFPRLTAQGGYGVRQTCSDESGDSIARVATNCVAARITVAGGMPQAYDANLMIYGQDPSSMINPVASSV